MTGAGVMVLSDDGRLTTNFKSTEFLNNEMCVFGILMGFASMQQSQCRVRAYFSTRVSRPDLC